MTAHDSTGARPSAELWLRLLVIALVVGLQIVMGIWFHLSATAYVLLTFPVLIAFQVLVARRPLREAWVRAGPGWRRGRKARIVAVALAILLAIVPAFVIVTGFANGSVTDVTYGVVAVIGAVAASYCFTAVRRAPTEPAMPRLGTTLGAGAKAAAITVPIIALLGLAALNGAGGARADASVLDFVRTAGVSFAVFVPAVFVVEEVLFRGAFDSYAHGDPTTKGPLSALVISAMWGIWHLPLSLQASGFVSLVPLILVHTSLGYPLTMAWRRSGSLAAPGVVHALIDAVRDGISALG